MIFDVWRRDLAGQVTVAELRSNIHSMEEEWAQAVPPKEDVPNPRFAAGQSVLQWWASLFKNENPAPSHTSKRQRPTWFSGKIVSPKVYMVDLMFAGYHNVVIMVAQCISVAHEPPLLLLRPCLQHIFGRQHI